MVVVLTTLTESLEENPTKQELKENIKDWNNNVGSYRKWFLDGLDRLNIAREKLDPKELTDNFNKLPEQSDRIFTHFKDNLGSKITVKLGKKTKRLNVIRSSLS